MKFYERRLNLIAFMRSVLLLFLIFSVEIHNLEMKAQNYYGESRIKPNPTKPINTGQTLFKSSQSKNYGFERFRFQNTGNVNQIPASEQNEVLMNSQVLDKKPPSEPEDKEQEVFPATANAGTEFSWGFLFWSFMNYKATNALSGNQSYWLSQRNVQHDHWEAVFRTPQKIDVISIKWRLPPKRFRVFFKLDDSSEFIPATEVFDKSAFLSSEGEIANQDAVSLENAVIFNKPIFAKRVRINLNEPLKKNSFSIFQVNFYQKQTVILVKNQLYDPCKNYCWYVNTDKPRENVSVEAYPCVPSVSMANDEDLFIYGNDQSIRHYLTNHCVGFSQTNELVLKHCSDNNPAYTVRFHADQTIFFTGYEDQCLVIDDTKKTSPNYVTNDTDVIITSQADNQTYKKENIKMEGENYWHSAPGQKKVTLQFLFGKIRDGSLKGQYENKKIDTIKIQWIREPKKFMVYTWKPGQSWILRHVYDGFKGKKSEISIIGHDAAAVMLILEKSHHYAEIGGGSAFGIKDIYIGYSSMKVIMTQCATKIAKYKIWDFDNQNYRKIPETPNYQNIMKTVSQNFEREINIYKNLKFTSPYIPKAKEKAQDFLSKLNQVKSAVGPSTIKRLQIFKSDILRRIANSKMDQYCRNKKEHQFRSATQRVYSGIPKLGTKQMPAEDCLQIKKMRKNVLSGFYFIQPECAPKQIRVFCDFTVFEDAVDIYIFNNGADEANPDLSYLGIKNFRDIRFQCSKVGLYPIQLGNKEMVSRIYQLLTSVGYDLSKPVVVPLGYDYTCKNGKCSKMINSLNDSSSPPIQNFFNNSVKAGSHLTKPGPFAGLGYSDDESMIVFDAQATVITAVMCSTNHSRTDSSDDTVKTISCEMNASNNGDLFIEGSDVLVKCPAACQQSLAPVYGSDLYHVNSAVCVAAIHSGILKISGGKILVRVQKGSPSYQGSASNGVKSMDYNSDDGQNAFSINKYEPKCPINQFPDKQEEIDLIKESSFLETSNFEESYNQSMKMKNMNFDPAELEGIDMEELNKAGLVIKKRENDSEDEEYNKLHNKNSNENIISNPQNYKFEELEKLQSQMSDPSDLPAPGDPSADTGGSGQSGTPSLPGGANIPNIPNIPGLGGLSNPASPNSNTPNSPVNPQTATNTPMPQDPNNAPAAGTPQMPANQLGGPGAPNGVPGTPADPTNAPAAVPQSSTQAANLPPSPPGTPSIPSSPNPNAMTGGASLGPSPGTPTPPPQGPNAVPPQAPIQPESGDENKDNADQAVNKRCNPITDDGIKEMKQIRKSADWDYISDLAKKNDAVRAFISNCNKELSWSKPSSKLSNKNIEIQYHAIASFKNKVQNAVRKIDEWAKARVERTKKLCDKWREELDHLRRADGSFLDYSKPKEKIFGKQFEIFDAKCDTKSNWDIHSKEIKGRSKAVGITSRIYSLTQPSASMMLLHRKSFFDFNLNVDILVKANGKAGIAFRIQNNFNYYAFLINKRKGYKAIIKVVNGNTIILKKLKDGGILINDWHSVNIKVVTGNIRVYIYDSEMPNKASSEKVMEVADYDFVKGSVGLFVNNMPGFFFDKLVVMPLPCWTPWTPSMSLKINLINASVLYEDFRGTLGQKFRVVDIPEGERDGPSNWTMNSDESPGKKLGIFQNSPVYDGSSKRKSSILVYKEKTLTNGVFMTCFYPQNKEGVVSVIFKYSNERNSTGQKSEKYYSFDLINSSNNPSFILRKFNDDLMKDLYSVNKPIMGLPTLGYIEGKKTCVEVEVITSRITIKVSLNESALTTVMSVREDSFRSGSVGVGTFKTPCLFMRMEMFPPRLSLSEADKNHILSLDINKIPIPDATSIKKTASSSVIKLSYSNSSNTAMDRLMSTAASLGSTLGLDFSQISSSSSSITSSSSSSFKVVTEVDNLSTGWKVCVTSRTKEQRNGYCKRSFNNQGSSDQCEANFCDTCCNTNVFNGHKNVLHLCKKTCYRSLIAENSNDDYKSTCINSQNPVQNIYAYCSSRMKNYDLSLMKFCKLDMCNLCCVTMDPMKKKNYSFHNLKSCFKDCSEKFNNDE